MGKQITGKKRDKGEKKTKKWIEHIDSNEIKTQSREKHISGERRTERRGTGSNYVSPTEAKQAFVINIQKNEMSTDATGGYK